MSEAPTRLANTSWLSSPAAMSPAIPSSLHRLPQHTIPSIFSRLKAHFRRRTTASWSFNGAVWCSWRAIMRFGNRWSDFPLLVTILTIFRSTGSRPS